jgi:hypothetical protein
MTNDFGAEATRHAAANGPEPDRRAERVRACVCSCSHRVTGTRTMASEPRVAPADVYIGVVWRLPLAVS